MRDTDTDSGQTAHRWLRIGLIVMLVCMTAVAPAAAQSNNTSETAPCAVGPPIYNEQSSEDDGPGDLEVMLVNDVSHSMETFSRMGVMRNSSKLLIDQLSTPDEVGLVSFGGSPSLESELTTDYDSVRSDVDALTADGSPQGTDVTGGITTAENELLNGANADENATKVMVIFGDGGAADESAARDAAEAAADNGIVVITVGLEQNEDFYADMASAPRYAYFSPSQDELESIYEDIGQQVGEIGSDLIVETRDLYKPGATHKYEVFERVSYESNDTTVRNNVTDEAAITSSNSSVLSVDSSTNSLTAVNDSNTSTWVRIDATAAGSTGCTNVIVSEANVSALPLLPGIWRFTAVLGDATLFALLLSTFCAVAMTRFTSAFGGLAVGQIGMTIGWLAGYVSWAIAAASLFVVLFIGLNLAERTQFAGGNLGRLGR